tara:strand:- start:1442 stop:2203 length:762 start_codon:yes stop_codon:yes gene_type:complete
MGILNLTPDSFYDGNDYLNNKSIRSIKQKYKYADIVDIGAESSRPGSLRINKKEELLRISQFNNKIFKDKILSIDSYKPHVIEKCLNNGYNMINDISGGGKNFVNIDLAKKYNVPIILMHMNGTPETMQENPTYNNVIDDINKYFYNRIEYCNNIGFNLNNIILDPGIGFGKTLRHNKEILLNLNEFKHFGCKILLGISRKSFLSINNDLPKDRLSQTLAISTLCLRDGVDIIRVHDVADTFKMINIINRIYQ